MSSSPATDGLQKPRPILLFNDECGVCRRVAHWVQVSLKKTGDEPSIIVKPIGEDPQALRKLSPNLNIWDAYANIHLLMPDGSMKLGGEAVAEVLRNVPKTRWFAWSFSISIFGLRPFQAILNVAYAVLADIRPIFGCESCGTPGVFLKPIRKAIKWMTTKFGKQGAPIQHQTLVSNKKLRPGSAP